MPTIRALILAEVAVHGEALAGTLTRRDGLEVVGVAAGVEEAVVGVGKTTPEIVLVDMPTTAAVVRTLVAAAPEVKVIVLAVSEAESDVITFAEAGAAGYVARDASIGDLVAVVESVSCGEVFVTPALAAKLFRQVATMARVPRLEPIDERLTARERDVLRLLEEGLSNKEIAQALSIELATVKNHVHSVLEKLDVHRRSAAAARARRLGLLD
jgi:two-component system nitrate/nitrite response regulator NarL